jgi:hypothetical protein
MVTTGRKRWVEGGGHKATGSRKRGVEDGDARRHVVARVRELKEA